jgi:protein-S-isoprenylcysteine O-methyltransferase Ste14
MPKTAKRNLIEQFVLGCVIAGVVGVAITKLGWHPPSLLARHANHFDFDVEWNRETPSIILWFIFSMYWTIASRNSAPTKNSESKSSTALHQIALNVALVLLFWPAPGLTGWFLPQRFHFLVPLGAAVQAAFILLAVWARRHLGRNWSAEVRIGVDHELIRSGPYHLLRHPIYTAMLGMFVGSAIASSQFHALVGVAILFVAYMRKTRLEEQILRQTFGARYDAYRRDTWALVPFVF